jgi:hypothetical protein
VRQVYGVGKKLGKSSGCLKVRWDETVLRGGGSQVWFGLVGDDERRCGAVGYAAARSWEMQTDPLSHPNNVTGCFRASSFACRE